MLKYILIALWFLQFNFHGISQKIDFGVEVQQNTNLVQEWVGSNDLNKFNQAFSLTDVQGDTLNIFFNEFSMVNNFEIPLYFRFNLQKRFFFDLKISNVSHKLNMQGISNYTDYYYLNNYGTYADFESQAIANGFANVDTSDYQNYMNVIIENNKQNIAWDESFKLLSFTGNIGVRLLPHRSINPYMYVGFTLKNKYSKSTYSYFDFDNVNVYENQKVQQGVNKFADRTYYINAGLGAEFYRFRLGVYYQGGLAFQFSNGKTNDIVYDVNRITPFKRIHSYGFNLSVNLFSAPIGKKVVYNDLQSEQLVFSNVKEKRMKWDFQFKFSRRFFFNVTSFYNDSGKALVLMARDTILFNNGTNLQSGEKIEVSTFGDLKKVEWSGQVDFALTRHFSKRFSVEFSLSASMLTADIETMDMKATVAHDSLGNFWFIDDKQPRINPGVFRTSYVLSTLSWALKYKIFDREIFDLSVIYGMGRTTLGNVYLSDFGFPNGVNSLDLYDDVDEFYYNDNSTKLNAHNGQINVDFNQSPDVFFNDFGSQKFDNNWQTPKNLRFNYPMIKFGFEASIERFTLGLMMDMSRGYMDGFLLDSYSSLYFSVGYKLWMKEKKSEK